MNSLIRRFGCALLLLFVISSSAYAQSPAGYALEFDGTNDQAFVDSSIAYIFDAFPLTLSVWVKTTQVSATGTGIVGDYDDGSLNGYSLFLLNGHARAWYFHDPANYVWDGGLGLDSGFIADGQWHHLAFVVDNNGGRLYVDHVLQASRIWTGNPGACNSTDTLRIGNYGNFTNTYFAGQMDQVVVWNASLSAADITNRYRLAPSGQESGLIGNYTFNAGTGDEYLLSEGAGYPAHLVGNPLWVLSTAPIGPAPVVTTLGPTGVQGGNALLRGQVNPRGVPATAFFQWGTTTAYGQTTVAQAAGSGTNLSFVTTNLSGLAPNTVYHYRLVVTNEFGRVEGGDLSFNSSTPVSPFAQYPLMSLGNPAWGDYDNDGDLDLLGLSDRIIYGNTGISILRNDGGGIFTEISVHTNFGFYVTLAPAWVDFDSDGDLDIFVGGYQQGSLIYRNDGGGVFTPIDVGLPPIAYGDAEWVDYDNDGDPDLLLGDGFNTQVLLYQNNGGHMVDIKLPFPPTSIYTRCSMAWGDYDNDGDFDMVNEQTGNVFRNFLGTFTSTGVTVPSVFQGVVTWADFSSDGNLDLLFSGSGLTALRRNAGGEQFVPFAAALPNLQSSTADWGDYDSDGDLDLLIGGFDGANKLARLYRNDAGTFADVGAALPGIDGGHMAWGDFDNDGALDFVMTDGSTARFYHNNTASNAPPASPGGLVADVRGQRVDFHWNRATDATTPQARLTYNMRVGTVPGGENVLTANANPVTGRRRLSGMGNVQFVTNHFLTLPAGTYYWSVQTIDAGYAASPFATEGSFTVGASDCGPGTALALDGINDYVNVPDNASLRRYPLTITAWIKTSRNTAAVDGIVSKYADASGHGYSLFIRNGHLKAWYFASPLNYVLDGGSELDGGLVADGQWHHVAFAVDAAGGRLFVDGVQTISRPWQGTAAATTTTEPLQIGRYYTYATAFSGQIDEVGLWDIGLSTVEVREVLPRRLAGSEANLVAYWNFNEGVGLNAGDVTGHGLNGTLQNGPTWVASGAAICAPFVRTVPSYDPWANAAPLLAAVKPQGLAATVWFEYGSNSTYGKVSAPIAVGPGETSLVISNLIHGLTPGTTNHFRAVATNQFGRVNGADEVFITRAAVVNDSIQDLKVYPLETSRIALLDITGDGVMDFIESGRYATRSKTLGYAGAAGVNFLFYSSWDAQSGLDRGALAAGDYDNDGDIDLFVSGADTNGIPTSLLWRNEITNGYAWTMTNAPHTIPGMFNSAAAWGDFDNDGDLDLAVVGQGVGGVYYCRVYSNDHGTLTNLIANLPGVSSGTVDWGDFDGDGDPDLLVTGTTNGLSTGVSARIYRNDGGTFVNIGANLTGVFLSAAAWADFDNDGDLDVTIGGRQDLGVFSTRIYRNDGGGVFVDIGAALPAISEGALAWADYDNDGLLDLLLTGSPDGSDGAGFTRIYRHTLNAGAHVFTDVNAGLKGMLASDVAWGDYDNSGTLDIVQSGRSLGNESTVFWQNPSYPNTRPGTPPNLGGTVTSNFVRLTWSPAVDAETPSPALTYNLRVGTTPGGVEVMSPHSILTNGFRRVAEMGNVQQGTNAWLRLKPGAYYWSVQAVDGAFAGSLFAPEQSFTVSDPCAPLINHASIPASGQFLLRFTGCTGVSYTVQRSGNLVSWSDMGAAPEISPGIFEFLDSAAAPSPRFYRVRMP